MATNSKRTFYAVGFDLLLLAVLAGLVVVALCAGKYPISAKESIDVLFGELFLKVIAQYNRKEKKRAYHIQT